MDWRRPGFLLIALLLMSTRLPAQLPASQPALTVLGDVARPGKFAVQVESTVRAAVAGATPLGDSVNVTILRQGQQRAQWSRAIRMSAADTSERVLDGDVLLVESLSPLTQQPARNAVVRSAGAATVVSLEDSGVTVNDVLVGLGIPVGPGSRLSLSARLRSQPPMNPASLSTVVQHGDVISVSHADQSNDPLAVEQSNTAAVRPAFSEWGGAAAPVPPVPPVPNMSAASAGQAGAGFPGMAVQPNAAGVIPNSGAEAGPVSPGQGFGGESGGGADVYTAENQGAGAGFGSGQPAAVVGRDGRELLTLEEQLQMRPIAGELSTHSGSTRSTVTAPAVESESAVTTSAAGASEQVNSDLGAVPQAVNAAGNQLLNGFVVAALLLSGCWVLAKSVTVSGRVISERPADAVASTLMGPVPQVVQPVVSHPVVSQPVVSHPVVSHPVVSQPVVSQPVVSHPVVSHPVVSQPVVSAAVCEPPAGVVSPVGYSILRGESLAVGMPSSNVVSGAASSVGGPPAGGFAVVESVSAAGSQSSGGLGLSARVNGGLRDGIEDLLRNQVPVEASAVRLPAGVQIYGRPNRPPVQRVDAPHPAVSGPHFSAGRRQVSGVDVAEGYLRGGVREGVEESAGETAAEQRLSRLTRSVRGAGGVPRG